MQKSVMKKSLINAEKNLIASIQAHSTFIGFSQKILHLEDDRFRENIRNSEVFCYLKIFRIWKSTSIVDKHFFLTLFCDWLHPMVFFLVVETFSFHLFELLKIVCCCANWKSKGNLIFWFLSNLVFFRLSISTITQNQYS